MNPRRILSSAALIVGTLALSLGLQAVAAFEQPASAPPGGDAAAPLNTSIDGQTKQGGLVLGTGAGVTTALRAYTGNIYLDSGSVTVKGGPLGTNGAKITTPSLCLGTDCRSAWPAGAGGGISSLTAGSGIILTPSPIVTTGSVAADFGTVQKRVSNTCSVGSSITAISDTGVASCGPKIQWGIAPAISTNAPNSHSVTMSNNFANTSYSLTITPSSQSQNCVPAIISKTRSSFTFQTDSNCPTSTFNWIAVGN